MTDAIDLLIIIVQKEGHNAGKYCKESKSIFYMTVESLTSQNVVGALIKYCFPFIDFYVSMLPTLFIDFKVKKKIFKY